MIIGVDMGGTKIAGGIVRNGKIIAFAQRPTEAKKGKAHILANIRAVIDELAKNEKIDRVGIGVPGLYRGTTSKHFPNVMALNGTDLKRALKLRCPVILEHDLRCVARAEHRYGVARGKGIVLFVNVGTGVSASILIDGVPYRGAHGHAGEAGHQWIASDKTEWEDVLGGPALLRRYHQLGGKGDRVSLAWSDRSRAGKILRIEATEMLACFIRNLAITLDPDRIVLVGGAIIPAYVRDVAKQLRAWGVTIPVHHVKLKKAGVIGAALASLDRS